MSLWAEFKLGSYLLSHIRPPEEETAKLYFDVLERSFTASLGFLGFDIDCHRTRLQIKEPKPPAVGAGLVHNFYACSYSELFGKIFYPGFAEAEIIFNFSLANMAHQHVYDATFRHVPTNKIIELATKENGCLDHVIRNAGKAWPALLMHKANIVQTQIIQCLAADQKLSAQDALRHGVLAVAHPAFDIHRTRRAVVMPAL